MIETNGAPEAAFYDRLLTVNEVAARLNISARQTWKLSSDGRMPKPLKLASSARWRESEISAFIAAGCSMTDPAVAQPESPE